MSELPKGWVETDFETILNTISNGIAEKQNKDNLGIPVSRIETIASENINYSRIGYVDTLDEQKAEKYLLVKGDILFSHINSPIHLGKTAIFDGLKQLYHGTNLLRIVTNHDICKSEYFNYFCKYTRATGAFSLNAQHAVNQSSLNQQKIKSFKIKLAPKAEQTRIVEKLDEVLAQVDAIKTRLDSIPAILKRFRQSVLAAAVSGRLTEEWRVAANTTDIMSLLIFIKNEREALKKKGLLKKNFGKHDPVVGLNIELPTSWTWACFDEIATNDDNALKAGPFGSSLKKADCTDSGYRVYGQEQVIAGNEKLVSYYIDENKFEQLKSCSIKARDILISLVGTIGKVLILSDKAEPGIINPRLVKLSLNEKIERSFIKFYLDSPISWQFFKGFSHGGTMDILNLGILKQLPLALPPVEEQKEIVRLVDQYFAFADTIEMQVKKAQTRVDNLTQSILAKAFRGELVPQNPSDEPAEKLLERIAQARKEAEALAKAAKKVAKTK